MRSLALAALMTLGLGAQVPFESRIADLEKVMEHHFRGPRPDLAREKSNRDIEAFNARTKAVNAELAEARARMEKALAPGQEAYAGLQKLDAELKSALPSGEDKEGTARYAARIEARNALARKVNDLNAAGQKAVEDYNAQALRSKAALDAERTRILAEQEAVNAKVADFEAFVKSGEDVTFFVRVNRLLADLKKSGRPEDAAALAKVRALRRELGAWALAGQAANPKGLVVVEAQVGDEPCWLIVDSGATDTVLSQELAEAAGSSAPGESVSLVVVGGLRLQGRQFRIPKLTVAGQTRTEVSASAVRPADVGIDGLLGQSFLKAFVYTIDERSPGKLLLKPR